MVLNNLAFRARLQALGPEDIIRCEVAAQPRRHRDATQTFARRLLWCQVSVSPTSTSAHSTNLCLNNITVHRVTVDVVAEQEQLLLFSDYLIILTRYLVR